MRIAFDTNVLAYAEGSDAPLKKTIALALIERIPGGDLVLPVQAAAELFRFLTRKLKRRPTEALGAVKGWQSVFQHQPSTTPAVLADSMNLVAVHQIQIFDAIILAASVGAEANVLLSEDMSDGFVWRGTTVVNPFKPDPHPLLADLLRPH